MGTSLLVEWATIQRGGYYARTGGAAGGARRTMEDPLGFLKRASGDRIATVDPVAKAMDQLRQAGVDPTAPHQTRHFVYVPGVKAAQQLARRLKTPDRLVEVDTSARTGYWLVVISQSMVITPEAMASLRAEFEAEATPLGGAYDRWQVDLQGS
jgi:hypothetical protein